jgi:hypothetical protein
MSTTVRIVTRVTPQAGVADNRVDLRQIQVRVAAAIGLAVFIAMGVIACTREP